MMTEDTLTALRNRYAAPEIPKCSICGGELSIQRSGGGSATIWACSGKIADPTGERTWIYAEGRSMADDHYERSRWTDYRRGGDSEVIELIDAFQELTLSGGLTDMVEADFYYRKRSDGGYEGPLHKSSIENCRKQSWSPLYTVAPNTAHIEPSCATRRTMPRSEFNDLVGKLTARNYGNSVDIADVLCAFNIKPERPE